MATQNGHHHITQKDTTYTKIFVGGLPYDTSDSSLGAFFEKFGEIEEAVVITDRSTGKSRGYGFVTMVTIEGAAKATNDPNPIIDGRKANVNLAIKGAKPRNNATCDILQSAFQLPMRTAACWPQSYLPSHHALTGYPMINPYAYYSPYFSAAMQHQSAISPTSTPQYLDVSPSYATVPECGFQYPYTTPASAAAAANGLASGTHQAAAQLQPMYTYAAVQQSPSSAAATQMAHLLQQQQQLAAEQM